MKKFLIIGLLCCFLPCFPMAVQQESVEVRYLTPPKLEPENILHKVLCHRPRREGQPRIEREENGNEVVIHDYGHGSGGWTMAWGAARAAVGLLQPGDGTKKVTVVGGGIAGLAAAYMLVKSGRIPLVIAREFDDLTSHKAGGLFAHQSSNPDQAIRDRVNGWIAESFKVYEQIALGKHTDFDGGARRLPGYFADRATSDLEACVKAGVMSPSKDVIVDFKNGTRRKMVVYDDNVFIDAPGMMLRLRAYLESKNVTFIQKELASLDQVASQDTVVFNCTGLGARALVHYDAHSLMPVQGHLLLLRGQNPDDLNYTLEVELGERVTDAGFPVLDLAYVFPKRLPESKEDEIGVGGGTFIKQAYKNTPHKEEFERVRLRLRLFFGIDKVIKS